MASTDTVHVHIDEHENVAQRLGRHVHHDPQSWLYPAPMAPAVRTVQHQTHGLPFDQGEVGSCTGNAAVGMLNTDPFYVPGSNPLVEDDAVNVYAEATRIDRIRGVYPPTDTGSNGLAVMKVLKKHGLIGSYRHAFSLNAALKALVLRPVIVGANWYEGFDSPDAGGLVKLRGAVRGGHEFLLTGIDAERDQVWAMNSWGPNWGRGGRFCFSWDELARLLDEQGDVTVGIR